MCNVQYADRIIEFAAFIVTRRKGAVHRVEGDVVHSEDILETVDCPRAAVTLECEVLLGVQASVNCSCSTATNS